MGGTTTVDTTKLLDQLRVTRSLARLPLTECALVSGIPRWRIQQIFAGTHSAAKVTELMALRRGLAQLQRLQEKKKAIFANHGKPKRRRHQADGQ